MILNFFVIISSVLLGSTFSKFFAKVFVYQKGINLFSSSLTQNIPAFNEKLAMDKSFDIMEFLIFVAISAIFFVIFYLIFNKRNYSPKQQIFIGLTNLIFAAFVYISTMFATYSGIYTIISTIIWYLAVSIISFFIPKVVPKWNDGKRTLFNGFFLGFFLLVLLNNLTTSVALPLATFVVTPIYFYLFAQKIKILNSPVFAILFLSFIFPFNRLVLLGILLITSIAIFVTRKSDFSKILPLFDKLYPILILFIFLYNPIFYLNTFDSIEEGFWAGWLQRLLSGQFIYKDFAAYHPPALAWGLYFFTKIFGASLFNLRLYFHLLQILGIVIIYLALNKVTKSKIIQIGILALIVAYGSSLVRNNIEIRVGSAIVPLLFVYWHNLNKRKLFLFIAGAMACLAFFVSLETGAASIIAVAVATLLSSSKKTWFSKLVYLFIGGIAITIPVLAFLGLNGALNNFFEYIIYYASTFASGYQNFPVEQASQQTLIQWHLVIKYFNTPGFLWEMTKFSLLGGLLLVIVKKLRNDFGPVETLVSGIAIFGLFLSRSALGRSDGYHLAFAWIPALLIIAYLLQFTNQLSKSISVAILCILIFFICRDTVQITLIQNQLIKFQTYGNPSGSYPSYTTKRSGIITGIETTPKEMDDLVTYIDSKVDKNENIFVFPQEPEIYFLTDRNNSTRFDTPTTFYTKKYQDLMFNELTSNPPKLVVYKRKFETQYFTNDTLHDINQFILNNYKVVATFGEELIMERN